MSHMRVIYITGLGDSNPVAQRRIVKTWRVYGIKPVFFQVNWEDNELFNSKVERLLAVIDDNYRTTGKKIGLIAASAGVSMALHSYAQRTDKIAGVVSICGKIGRPEYVLDRVRKKNPAFGASMDAMNQTLRALSPEARKKVLCLSPFTDKIVDIQDQTLDGALRRRVWSFGHVATIVVQLSLGAYKNCRFLRHQLKNA